MIDSELLTLENNIYKNCSLKITNVTSHDESKQYCACSFSLNDNKVIFRKSKITPKKQGQFVTFWKRSEIGPIQPYHENDDFDFFVVNSSSENNFGQFIFPKSILIQKGIITSNNKEGKRAFRVYPIWEKVINKQAIKTQSWQKDYFIILSNSMDFNSLKKMYTI
ncbi:MepB family protein [Flavobacterium jejuense]|uniref:MepB family protein n=1 Tax=Flavobacterium jejuense TaxID=1544455 RepID=A0ABX0IUU8_9FLAO|nr:MepB family protein [Flavobacterium jejuense]NHN25856.1 MepB family protein [Flavobacterium jejuense]